MFNNTDFFNFSTDRKYDIVFSLGFIEHFNNTRDVILRHVDLLASGGLLLIVLPNLLGLNGWIQRRFDKENYDAHNLKSMEIDRLKKIMATFSLKDLRVEYIINNEKVITEIRDNIRKNEEFGVDDLDEFFKVENFNNLIDEDGIERYMH